MVETSDDRNGVVVNRARRGTGDRLNKRHSEPFGRAEVQYGEIAVRKFKQKVSTNRQGDTKQCFTALLLVLVR